MRGEISPYETRSSTRTRVLIPLLLIVLVAAVGGAWWFFFGRNSSSQSSEELAMSACRERVASGLDDPQGASFSDVVAKRTAENHWEVTGSVSQPSDSKSVTFTCKVKHEDDKYFATYKLNE